jgi:hypothetical protein
MEQWRVKPLHNYNFPGEHRKALADIERGGIVFSTTRLKTTAFRRFKSQINSTWFHLENADGGGNEFYKAQSLQSRGVSC